MQLTPRQPPGNKSRKARAFNSEILRLRALGYSSDAIREALADVGVHVSISTVHREAARPAAVVFDFGAQMKRGRDGRPVTDDGRSDIASTSHPTQGDSP